MAKQTTKSLAEKGRKQAAASSKRFHVKKSDIGKPNTAPTKRGTSTVQKDFEAHVRRRRNA